MSKFTYKEFKKQFPNEQACLDRIFKIRYGNLEACPKCGCEAAWRKISTRRCYQCRHCYEQFYPTAGTVFEKTRTPIIDWFYVIFLFTTTRNGVAAKEIERQLGVTYKTAFRMGHKIRELMNKIGAEQLKGFVEIDESYYGNGKSEFGGRNNTDKKPIFGMVERMGKVIAYVPDNIRKDQIFPLIEKHVDKSAHISTDEFQLYNKLNSQLGYTHETIKHSMNEYKRGVVCTNTIEGYFSQLKRMITGTHVFVSTKLLHQYVNECTFRYNMRHDHNEMFETLINQLPKVEE